MIDCLVCMYRQTFRDAAEYPVHYAYYAGLAIDFEAVIHVCREHADWVYEDFPETLKPLMGIW